MRLVGYGGVLVCKLAIGFFGLSVFYFCCLRGGSCGVDAKMEGEPSLFFSGASGGLSMYGGYGCVVVWVSGGVVCGMCMPKGILMA